MQKALVRQDPFEVFVPMERLIRRVFSDLPGQENGSETSDHGTLALDISQTNDAVVVRASLPGFRKEDVNIEVDDGVLSIDAAREESNEVNDEKFFRRERYFGSVSRRISLPAAVTEDSANAELKDGVLTLTLPKVAEAQPRKIAVS